jgi:hypothetical protein
MSDVKTADQLAPLDFAKYPVWEFDNDREAAVSDETYVRPVKHLPIDSLSNRLVGTKLSLNNGWQVFGVLGNINLANIESTQHFLTVTVFRSSGQSFGLARYHDVDYSRRDASALAVFLGLSVPQVFPIKYDITAVAVGLSECLRSSIPANPKHQLSREALTTLALA